MLKEFREFVARGNIFDLAAAVVMGAAFGRIVDSFVNDILMPPIGLVLGDVDFTNLFINLSGQPVASLSEAQAAGVATINYGLFINQLIIFVIIAAAVFLLIKQVNRFSRTSAEAAAPTTKECQYCRMKIAEGATRCPHCTSALAA